MSKVSSLAAKIQKIASVIQTNTYVSAITNGLMSLMPITIIGAMISLINALPFEPYQNFLITTNLKMITSIPAEITTNLLSLYAVFLIAVKFAESKEVEGVPAGMLSLMAFFIVTPFNSPEGAFSIESYTTFWFGAQGLITAFIIALLVGKIYTIFTLKGWVFKMPAGVPPTVSKSFASLIPGFIVAIVALVIRYTLSLTPFEHLHQLIFGLISAPLRALGSSIFTMILAVILCHLLWLVGVHGTLLTASIFIPIWTALGTENLAAYNAGLPIPNLVSGSLFFMAIAMGAGGTLGLSISMLRAKSKQYSMLGKLAIVPNIVGINEPIIFGLPIIMNFTLAIPFILVPLIIVISAYLGMVSGILPRLPGTEAPMGVPIIVAGMFSGGWKWAVFQALSIVLSYFVYLPFFKVADKQAYDREQEAEINTNKSATN